MRKTILPLTALLGLSAACSDETEPWYDFCMDEISAQTDTPKEELASLTCASLLEKITLPLPQNYITLKEENAIAITHCSSLNFGNFLLQHNQHCYQQVKEFLGIQPITQCIIEANSHQDEPLPELEAGFSGRGAAGCMVIRSHWDGNTLECVKEDSSNPLTEDILRCAPHEPTHIFVAGTVLHREPLWLNEGLAEYVMKHVQEDITLDCFADGFRFTGDYSGTKVGTYVPLHLTREEHERNGTTYDAYLTGACVWDHIDTNYGRETFRTIICRTCMPAVFLRCHSSMISY